jgi:hypothetical protein
MNSLTLDFVSLAQKSLLEKPTLSAAEATARRGLCGARGKF